MTKDTDEPPGPARGLSTEQRRALAMLADLPTGSTEVLLRAHGFPPDLVSRLVRGGLAAARPTLVRGPGRRPIGIVWVTITEKGRQVLAEAGSA